MVRARRRPSGHTLVELVVTVTILAILGSAVLPLAAVTRKREKEIELRRGLREIRAALDMYHELCAASLSAGAAGGAGTQPRRGTQGQPPQQPRQVLQLHIEDDPGGTCYPKELDVLVEGVETATPDYKLKFLRRIPRDPFNVEDDEHDAHGWLLRSTTDDPESNGGWNKQNVFDVRSASKSQALDGSFYEEW